MKDFVLTLISVALLNGALGMLSPDGDLKKYVKLLGSLCLVCAIASPIFGAIKSGGEFDRLLPDVHESEGGYEDIYGEALAKGAEETLERSLKEKIIAELKLKDSEIDVDASLEKQSGEYSVSGVTVYIHGGGIFTDPREITSLVNGVCGCSCSVIYD